MDNTEFTFKVTSCDNMKWLDSKPESPEEKGIYFTGNIFTRWDNVTLNYMKNLIEVGATLTYIYEDERFLYKGYNKANNYVGTQYICVDVDGVDEDPDTFVSHIKYQPTIYHTTFSNLTKIKKYKWCFHLIYVFDEVIEGEQYFKKIFSILASDHVYDKKAKDPHRCIFTSNPTLPNYVYRAPGKIYSASEFKAMADTMPDEENKKKDKPQRDLSHNMQNCKIPINEGFLNDLYNLSTEVFIEKYSRNFLYATSSYVNPAMYNGDGYADLRNVDYYVVPSSRGYWNKEHEQIEIPRVQQGFRDTMLFMDAIAFMKIFPDMTIEHLIFCLVYQVHKHYNDPNNEFTEKFIVGKAVYVFNNIDLLDDDVQKVRRRFKINKSYWSGKGYNNWLEVTNIIRRKMRDDDFGSMYDFGQTLERNLSDMNDAGIKTTKRTLVKWLKNNGYEYCTEKDLLKMKVRELHCIQPDLTVRQIAYKTGVSPATVCRYLKDKDYPCYDP